ncbi:hypothetical protein JAAARDRAFT_205723 [Jaapia argillacea MUCL 33604]|uniref:Calcipressin n=1 Tax=Jaapia argillacea MUCL 33604 TaxID=933084 RepID=A0A067PYE8_9AGAM|nr:hypothetical protein JAAARDRAFT_205723 [Jaapia argillacea MUCL 33604]
MALGPLSVRIPSPPSPASLSGSSGAPSPQVTNTLIIAQLPSFFFDPLVLEALRHHFATYGEIHSWVPIKSFARAILVYFEPGAAEQAKLECDGLVVERTRETPEVVLRVFRGDPTPLEPRIHAETGADLNYLRPPEIEKNFLISPPGSPPVGWEHIKEEPPNATPLADDLIAALKRLELKAHHGRRVDGVEVLVEPEESGVGIYVEDFDGDEEGSDEEGRDWAYGESSPSRLNWRPIVETRTKTAMPVTARPTVAMVV